MVKLWRGSVDVLHCLHFVEAKFKRFFFCQNFDLYHALNIGDTISTGFGVSHYLRDYELPNKTDLYQYFFDIALLNLEMKQLTIKINTVQFYRRLFNFTGTLWDF